MPQHVPSREPIRPLLKWAGGKRQLLPQLGRYFPTTFARYVEPFVGSGAVFFHLFSTGRLEGRRSVLADVNADLIGCYRAVQAHAAQVVEYLSSLEREHRAGGDVCYYDVRDRRFNPLRAALTDEARASSYSPALAAMLIFLNRTGFNGLFRLNRAGAFNVPAGRYAKPRICDEEHVQAVANVLRSPSLSIAFQPFDETLADAGTGDFVYCDPPYAPLSATANFAHYTAGGFSAFDQRRLQQAVIGACARGAQVVLSNSSAPEVIRIYSAPEARRAGLTIVRVPARRAINSRASARGPVDEVIVTNVAAAALQAIRPRMVAARSRRKARTA